MDVSLVPAPMLSITFPPRQDIVDLLARYLQSCDRSELPVEINKGQTFLSSWQKNNGTSTPTSSPARVAEGPDLASIPLASKETEQLPATQGGTTPPSSPFTAD